MIMMGGKNIVVGIENSIEILKIMMKPPWVAGKIRDQAYKDKDRDKNKEKDT